MLVFRAIDIEIGITIHGVVGMVFYECFLLFDRDKL